MTKVDIISGFLGAGKTTFIKQLINQVYNGQKLVLIENAGHGIAYLVDPDKYIKELNEFYNEKTLNLS